VAAEAGTLSTTAAAAAALVTWLAKQCGSTTVQPARMVPTTACRTDCCNLAVVLWGEAPSAAVERGHHQLLAVTFDDVIARGIEAGATWQPPAQARQDVATLAFTSGTGGSPKARPASSVLVSTPECSQHVMGLVPACSSASSYLTPDCHWLAPAGGDDHACQPADPAGAS
jgi:acyl-coenzyme A synthetase/AMP-(fatty) acid ligase